MDLDEQRSIPMLTILVGVGIVFLSGMAVGFIASDYMPQNEEIAPADDSTDPVATSTPTEEINESAQAGVTFAEDNDTVTVQLVSIQRAERIYVEGPDGNTKTLYDDASDEGGVGETVTFSSLEHQDQVVVVGVWDGYVNIIQTHTMTDW